MFTYFQINMLRIIIQCGPLASDGITRLYGQICDTEVIVVQARHTHTRMHTILKWCVRQIMVYVLTKGLQA